MDPVVSALTAGKHIVESKDGKFYVGVDSFTEPVRIFFSKEDAQTYTECEEFAVFSQQGMFDGWLVRECGDLIEVD